MASATHVLLHGHSAGGVGTFHNTDAVAAAFSTGVVVKGVPMGGWFIPAEVCTQAVSSVHRADALHGVSSSSGACEQSVILAGGVGVACVWVFPFPPRPAT